MWTAPIKSTVTVGFPLRFKFVGGDGRIEGNELPVVLLQDPNKPGCFRFTLDSVSTSVFLDGWLCGHPPVLGQTGMRYDRDNQYSRPCELIDMVIFLLMERDSIQTTRLEFIIQDHPQHDSE